MQFQTEVGRQDKPAGHFLFFAGGGHGLRQLEEKALLKTALEKIPLINLTDHFQSIELPAPERFQHLLGMMLDEVKVHLQGS